MKKIMKPKKPPKEQEQRFLKAKQSLEKLQEEITPFIRRRHFKKHSTAGQWCETSSLCNS